MTLLSDHAIPFRRTVLPEQFAGSDEVVVYVQTNDGRLEVWIYSEAADFVVDEAHYVYEWLRSETDVQRAARIMADLSAEVATRFRDGAPQ